MTRFLHVYKFQAANHLPGCVRWISSQLLLGGEVLEHGFGSGLNGLKSDNVVWPIDFGIYGIQ